MKSVPVAPLPFVTQLSTRLPRWLWDIAGGLSVLALLLTIVLLIVSPKDGLRLWWGLLVPFLPLVWFVAPGLWRNVCPLAAVNQLPRRTKTSFSLTPPVWWKEYAPVLGMLAFLIAVVARPTFFNASGIGTATLVGGSLTFALIGGMVFKGKSGWCSSLCPLLPVERLYGQTPVVIVPNAHCRPCMGCTANCFDSNPPVTWSADLHDKDQDQTGNRLSFSGAFLGAVIAYFSVPLQLSTETAAAWFLLAMGAGVGLAYAFHAFLKLSLSQVNALSAASAICVFYWLCFADLSR